MMYLQFVNCLLWTFGYFMIFPPCEYSELGQVDSDFSLQAFLLVFKERTIQYVTKQTC